MNADPTSLDNLRDLAEPSPVSWWPLAPGWWVVLGLLALITGWVVVRTWRHWRANAYRRAALRELQSANDVSQIAEILKRAALVAYPRSDVAALTGPAWIDWLAAAQKQPVPAEVADALTRGVFDHTRPMNLNELRSFAADWIRQHQVVLAQETERK